MKYIYIACPWTPVGGGMFKVADYLLQGQRAERADATVELRPLDTRGSRHAAWSALVVTTALAKIVRGRVTGELAGVHINMAERLSLVRKSLVVMLCRFIGVPVVLHLHAAQLHHFYRSRPAPLRRAIRWMFSLPSSVVVLGQAARGFVVDELGVPAERVEIVINGVPEPSAVRRVEGAAARQRMLFLGSDWERKGLFDLLRAVAQGGFDPARHELCVAGRGDQALAERTAAELGISALVTFDGWADQQKASALLASADVLVLPSYDEGLPLVILEALANGVAVVCTPVGEIPLVLTDGQNVCFVPPGDIGGIAAGVRRVLEDADLRHHLQRQGRRTYEEQFSLDRFFGRVAQIHRRHFGVAAEPREAVTHD